MISVLVHTDLNPLPVFTVYRSLATRIQASTSQLKWLLRPAEELIAAAFVVSPTPAPLLHAHNVTMISISAAWYRRCDAPLDTLGCVIIVITQQLIRRHPQESEIRRLRIPQKLFLIPDEFYDLAENVNANGSTTTTTTKMKTLYANRPIRKTMLYSLHAPHKGVRHPHNHLTPSKCLQPHRILCKWTTPRTPTSHTLVHGAIPYKSTRKTTHTSLKKRTKARRISWNTATTIDPKYVLSPPTVFSYRIRLCSAKAVMENCIKKNYASVSISEIPCLDL